ncbi:protein IWS1 homolog isoform X3 [Xenia sp. Carnegie-2017]|uniref:protein IWS1 homolog isoform X3 n=1 Tax=Xenia sp. Carnegie-2017 TaxID=2897299 RepID=UPI001F03661A|nr:protein IWS1 homolog isoform X3 [Xenia sp. Carnegie-2017]
MTIQCDESCSTWVIDVRSAEFGVLMKKNGRNRKPYKISSVEKECLSSTALSSVQKQCNGRSECSFKIEKERFLSRPFSCRKIPSLLVYYTCKTPSSVSRTTPVAQISTSSKRNTLSIAPSTRTTLTDNKPTPSTKATQTNHKTTPSKNATQIDSKATPSKEAAKIDNKTTPSKKATQIVSKATPSKEAAKIDYKTTPAKKAKQIYRETTPSKKATQIDRKTTPCEKTLKTDIKTTPSKKSTAADPKTSSEKTGESSTKDSLYLGIIAGIAVGAVLFTFLAVIFVLCKKIRKKDFGMHMAPVKYKKRTKEEKHLTVNIVEEDEIPIPKVLNKTQNTVMKIRNQLRSVSETEANSQDDTTYQELDTTQMNQDDNYTSLHANVHDATYEELDTKQMKKESAGYESLGMKGKSNKKLAYVMTY